VRFLRAALGRLDPWAALLLGVFLALGIVILLATPGPWRRVAGLPPPVTLAPAPPSDVVVFVLGKRDAACTGVVWLHVDHGSPSLTAIVVAPETQGFVKGGGFAPLRRIVDDVGPQAAAEAAGQALGVQMDAWVTLDRETLRLAVSPMFTVGDERLHLGLYQLARAAWEGRGGSRRAWLEQYATLRQGLPRVPFERLNVVGFANYVLGFGLVENDLDLQGATSLATTFKALLPDQVYVRAVGAAVDVCRRDRAWRVDRSTVVPLRESLAAGLRPPTGGPAVSYRLRSARVLVVLPGWSRAADAYTAKVRRKLRHAAGAPVSVRSVVGGPGRLAPRTTGVVDSWRPLAVLVAPPLARGPRSAERLAASLRELSLQLRLREQPAVMSAPLQESASAVGVDDALTAAVQASGLPVSTLAGLVSASGSAEPLGPAPARRAASANVQTLMRACWPGALAPRLASTRLGFEFAACRRTSVGVLLPGSSTSERAAAHLRLWGYQAAVTRGSSWEPALRAEAVYYHKGMRRAALALGGDLRLRRDRIILDEAAPFELTLAER
jgi:hypothetical protein